MGKPKKVIFQLIDANEKPEPEPYILLRDVRAEQHFDTAEARIALAWQKGIKPDVDGRLMLGRCVRATDLQRELVELDFVILLNREVWEDIDFTEKKKLALLDHELCHAARSVDSDGEPRIDTKGRPVWRTRGHDIEEFREIVDRHGCWKGDLEKFAEAIFKRKKSPLFGGDAASAQATLTEDPTFLAAADRLAAAGWLGEVGSMTITTPGMEPVVIDQAAADAIHKAAVKSKRKRDPG